VSDSNRASFGFEAAFKVVLGTKEMAQMRKLLWLLLVLYAPIVLAQSSFTFDVPYGPHPVGFRAVYQYDESRTYAPAAPAPSTSRPILTLIWYPATVLDKPMRYREYVEFSVTQMNFKKTPEMIQADFREVLKSLPLKEEPLAFELARVQWATRDAPALAGKFPVVIYAPSWGGGGYENTDLCELLASQGYLVLASYAAGADDNGMTMDRAGMDLQVGDIHFLMKYASQIAEADTARIAIAGYSWGGIANAFAAVDKPNVRALVFLDGAIRHFAKLVEEAKLNRGASFGIPILYFSSAKQVFDKEPGRMEAGDKVLQRLTSGKRYLLKMDRMSHGDFGSVFIRQIPPESYKSATPQDVSASYGWMSRYTLQFLDATLKGDRNAAAFMERSPTENKVPAGLMSAMPVAKL
jgi:pimeloyl-ACP methyl ester carboxylesterase